MTIRYKASRRLTAAASITAMVLGSFALTGCGNDDEDVPPVGNEPAMEQPTDDDLGMDQEQGVDNQPVDQQQAIGDPEPADQAGDEDERVPGTAPGGGEDPMMQEEPAPTDGTGGGM
ncbi:MULTISPECIES: hypothetical protein [Halomonadaceae]|uniref:hypothetical protein n=1 Tax=Halomonadaceae TaxID=28256 RepID=UPI001598A64C|nr:MULTISPECIES: hypothetical protein [Halomonas]QJQ94816.1 hypothetical protein HIO72_05640 [Halomonas sp. PA5]